MHQPASECRVHTRTAHHPGRIARGTSAPRESVLPVPAASPALEVIFSESRIFTRWTYYSFFTVECRLYFSLLRTRTNTRYHAPHTSVRTPRRASPPNNRQRESESLQGSTFYFIYFTLLARTFDAHTSHSLHLPTRSKTKHLRVSS